MTSARRGWRCVEWGSAPEEAFLRAESSSHGEAIVAVNRATLDQRRGRSAEAIAAFEGCVARHPGYAPAQAGLGFALRDARRYDEAVPILRRAS